MIIELALAYAHLLLIAVISILTAHCLFVYLTNVRNHYKRTGKLSFNPILLAIEEDIERANRNRFARANGFKSFAEMRRHDPEATLDNKSGYNAIGHTPYSEAFKDEVYERYQRYCQENGIDPCPRELIGSWSAYDKTLRNWGYNPS